MSEFKGTKGKWFTLEYAGTHLIQDGDFYESNDILNFDDVTEEIARANALLISKAPEMLEMLEKCLSEFEQCKDAIWELMEYQDGWESNKDRVEEKIEKIKQLIKQATEI